MDELLTTEAKRRVLTDEAANMLTHALGLMLSIAATTVLVLVARERGDAWQIVGCSVFGAALIALYAASTLSHAFQQPRLRHFFRTVDQVCIFLLIAGTYTPFALAFLRGGWWWALLAAIWGLALLGIIFKVFVRGHQNVATWSYVALGWLPIIAVRPIVARVPGTALAWLLAGGIFYTIGTLFLARDERYPYFHAIWHLFVIGGSACHYIGVLLYVLPWPK